MTQQQVLLVQKTWKILRNIKPEMVGDVFYAKLFSDKPGIKHLFKSPMTGQSKKVIEMISMIVGRLEHIEEINESLKELARRHAGYGVRNAHYSAVGEALLWTLQQGLGPEWNQEVKEAWTACYRIVEEIMTRASVE